MNFSFLLIFVGFPASDEDEDETLDVSAYVSDDEDRTMRVDEDLVEPEIYEDYDWEAPLGSMALKEKLR